MSKLPPENILIVSLVDSNRELVVSRVVPPTLLYFVHATPQRFTDEVLTPYEQDLDGLIALLFKLGYQRRDTSDELIARTLHQMCEAITRMRERDL